MKNTIRSTLALILALLLSLCLFACKNEPAETPDTDGSNAATDGGAIAPEGLWANATYLEDTAFGEGAKTVTVKVIAEDKSVTFTVKTDAKTLGEALIEHGLIAGDMGDYGLYIKYVNGIRADYDLDKRYWNFTKNGEYMMTGADMTEIADGEAYEFTYAK
ncbi:MAG: DUF4430 domain-containing protein [Clostridia bacterium]|nr:DUF4430 domain-containing protein [Clostridia bacterium]